ncbi:MAG: UDP-N-acetylmuramoyl-L-alanyl-D-glutamate--2,6-diaminopimelate ligase [Bacteroidales bacterium]|nr:UDP-N-acetylmuramoyl-L-alanyl-D-glutamate--2,6-diaminopimelate ligase [Bacteroidales bacterium]MBQ2598904.1 UDP-N-acetylmuramoyl-L-alanyl-D-glutamate--2,6-diaminopimelate ligase [Bacteroidales bacterium]
MKLNNILQGIDIVAADGDLGREISSLTFDSRTCAPGCLFIAVPGTAVDGHSFIAKAVEAGASAVIYQNDTPGFEASAGVTRIKVKDSRRALALAADNWYDHPSGKLKLVGITGTNGKTTTVTLLYNLFTSLGWSCGLISTIANYIDGQRLETSHTTPDPIELNSLLARMADKGCSYCFMEVSSHSVDQERIAGLEFQVGIFSNLTHDHLDYHKTFAAYRDCKKRFFDQLPQTAFALTNLDDRNGEVMVQNTRAQVRTYACKRMADFRCKIIEESLEGMLVSLDGTQVWTRFIGAHNAYNLLAVYATAVLLGAKPEEVLVKMSALGPVPGRLDFLRGGNDLTAVVDYSHTPDALENALKTLRETARDRALVCVFGCGGNRDKTKRPEMGAIAAKYADRVVVTSDNPRHEDPEEIIREIRAGMDTAARAKSLFITDRREAIRTALMTAPQGAVILVAGKGHEDYQIIGDVKTHFDDKEVIAESFEEMN